MENTGRITSHDYKLLSIAAILDVFETVNSIYAESHRESPICINIIQTPEQIKKDCDSFHGYPVKSITSDFVFVKPCSFHLLVLLVQKLCGNDIAIRIAKITKPD